VTFAFIAGQKAKGPAMNIAWAYRTLCPRSGHHDWGRAQAQRGQRQRRDGELAAIIRAIDRQSRGTYGAPRVDAELRLGLGIRVGRQRLERPMRAEGLEGVTRRRPRGLTRRDATAVPNDDLVARQFTANGPNQLWVADITEHPSDDWPGLSGGGDRRLEPAGGRPLESPITRAELVVGALDMACWRRRPVAGQTVHHSDHGTQTSLKRSSQRCRVKPIVGARRAPRRESSI
jgi:putative transposase